MLNWLSIKALITVVMIAILALVAAVFVIDRMTHEALATIMAGFLVGLALAVLVYRRVARIVVATEDFGARIERGEFAARFTADAGGETATLAAALNRMVDRLREAAEHEATTAQRLAFLVDATPAVIYATKASGDYGATYISPNVVRQLGWSPQDFINDSGFWSSHIHPDDRDRVIAHQAGLFTVGHVEAEYRLRHQDGSWRWMHDQTALVRDDAGATRLLYVGEEASDAQWWLAVEAVLSHLGEATGVEALRLRRGELLQVRAADLPEAIRARFERLAQASRMKSVFLAAITHELRTPLNSVIGFAELLLDQVPGPLNAKQAEFAADILASGKRLLKLVEGILDMSRLGAQGVEPEREPVDIGAALQERLAVHRQAAEARGITMGMEVAADAGSVQLDPMALRRILDVLLDNAIKFNREAGTIRVSAQRADGTLEIAVADTGIGIAPADLPKLFQPLVQIDATLARKYGGIGLGLALAQRLAQRHGGTAARSRSTVNRVQAAPSRCVCP